jgi:hypothetical protein
MVPYLAAAHASAKCSSSANGTTKRDDHTRNSTLSRAITRAAPASCFT